MPLVEVHMGICTEESHAALKRNPAAFGLATTGIGMQDDGDGGRLYLANCNACHSTLSLPVPTCFAPAVVVKRGDRKATKGTGGCL